MSNRKWLVVGLLGAVGATALLYASAGAQTSTVTQFTGGITKQRYREATSQLLTSSTEFVEIEELRTTVNSGGPIMATVSGAFTGEAIEIRVRGASDLYRPGTAVLFPNGPAETLSASFAKSHSRRAGCHTVSVEWRSPSGAEVSVNAANVVLRYRSAEDAVGCI